MIDLNTALAIRKVIVDLKRVRRLMPPSLKDAITIEINSMAFWLIPDGYLDLLDDATLKELSENLFKENK